MAVIVLLAATIVSPVSNTVLNLPAIVNSSAGCLKNGSAFGLIAIFATFTSSNVTETAACSKVIVAAVCWKDRKTVPTGSVVVVEELEEVVEVEELVVDPVPPVCVVVEVEEVEVVVLCVEDVDVVDTVLEVVEKVDEVEVVD